MKWIKRILILSFVITISGCGFGFRSANSIPKEARTLYLQTPNPYTEFSTQLKAQLRALGIHLVKNPEQAPVILQVVSNTLTHTNPPISSTSAAMSYSFTYTTVVELIGTHSQVITGPTTLSTTRTLTLNSSQVLNSSIGHSTTQQMIRENVDKLYFWLISDKTRQALIKHAK